VSGDIQNLRIDKLGTAGALGPVVVALATAQSAGETLRLDLTSLARSGAEHRRADLTTTLLLSNLLIGAFGRVSLDVVWPDSETIISSLERGALPFALAQRAGSTSFINAEPRKIAEWKKDWRPRTESLWDELEAAQIERRTYAYINTHRLGRSHFRGYHEGAAMPWLRKLVPVPKDATARQYREGFVALAERAVVELNENIPEHAFDIKGEINDRVEWLLPAETDGASLVTCSLTKGGSQSWNRLHLLAFDNGYGIGRTLRWQHPGLKTSVADLVETILLKQLHQRGIPGHNGIGLWWLNDIACTVGGEVEIITEDDLDPTGQRCTSVLIEYEQGEERYVRDQEDRWTIRTVSSLPVPIRGTIVKAVLHVPRTSEDMWVRPLADDRELVH
jgi:hypothetical protein